MDEVWNLYDARIEFEPDARSLAKKYRRRGTPKSVREILDMLLRDFREAIANQYSAILPVLYWFRSKMGITVITLAALVIAGLYFVFLTPDIGRVANDTVESSRLEASTLRDADTMPVHTSEKRLPEGLSSTKGQNANSHDETENLNYSERSSELAVDSELNENADPNNATQWDTSQIGDSDDSENTADLFIETNLGNVYLLVGPHSLAVKLGNSYDLKMKILKPRSDPECSFNGKTYLCRLTDRRLGKYSVRFGSALGYITPETVTVELKKPSTYIKRFYQRQK